MLKLINHQSNFIKHIFNLIFTMIRNLTVNRSLRAANATGGIGGDSRERELADSRRSAEIGGKAGSADASASSADGEKVEVILAGGVGAVLRFSADGEGAMGWREGN